MKYIKFFENNDWEFSPEKRGELISKYTKISKQIEIEIIKMAVNITSITIKDVYDDINKYGQLKKTIKSQKETIDKIKNELWEIVDRYELKEFGISDLEKIHDKLDYDSMELDDISEFLDSIISFVENVEHKELLSKVLKGNSEYQINI